MSPHHYSLELLGGSCLISALNKRSTAMSRHDCSAIQEHRIVAGRANLTSSRRKKKGLRMPLSYMGRLRMVGEVAWCPTATKMLFPKLSIPNSSGHLAYSLCDHPISVASLPVLSVITGPPSNAVMCYSRITNCCNVFVLSQLPPML